MSTFRYARHWRTLPKAVKPYRRSFQTAGRYMTRTPTSNEEEVDIDKLLSTPSWSVKALLPSKSDAPKRAVPTSQLHHLLRLSALPMPESAEKEAEMLKTLQSQLHFVREIQKVDTTGIEPLQAIRDESEHGVRENTIGLDALKEALAKEEFIGRLRRPRRKRGSSLDETSQEKVKGESNGWDVLGTASRRSGQFFTVDTNKKKAI